MAKNPLIQKVNFYVSVCFIGSFTLLMITTVMNVERFDNPITDAVAATRSALQN